MLRDPFRTRLIKLVEIEPSVWDITSDGYRMPERKKNAWARIQKGMQDGGHICTLGELRSVWKNLKDLRRKKKAQGPAARKDWVFGEMLAFLDKIDCERNLLSTFDADGFALHMDPLQLSSSERGSSGARSPVQAYVKNIKEDDDSLELMRATEEAVNAMVHIQAQAQNEVVQEQDNKKSNEDKFSSFGSWVGLQLRGLDVNAANNKMHLIATVLLTDASVVMSADDAHSSGDRSSVVLKNRQIQFF